MLMADWLTANSSNETVRAFRRGPFSFDGGAGNRTPVREEIHHSVYVRSPPVEVSRRWPAGNPLLDKLSKLSPCAGERTAGLSRVCDTHEAASGGLPHGQVL
jgi:hypothetical protein